MSQRCNCPDCADIRRHIAVTDKREESHIYYHPQDMPSIIDDGEEQAAPTDARQFWNQSMRWSYPMSIDQACEFAEAYAADLRRELSRVLGIAEELHHQVHPSLTLAKCKKAPCNQFRDALSYEKFVKDLWERAEKAEGELKLAKEALQKVFDICDAAGNHSNAIICDIRYFVAASLREREPNGNL